MRGAIAVRCRPCGCGGRWSGRTDGPVRVVLIADDPLARLDVPHFCAQAGLNLRHVEEAAHGWRSSVERG